MAASAMHALHLPARSTAPRRPDRIGLSREEEVDLAARAARGARDRLVETNPRLIRAIVREFLIRELETEDLVGEGNLGRIRAAMGSLTWAILLHASCDGGTR
jgi:DNA-directed RNA polymerase sigma subunit (sigma70/sigma32)